jgi:hypothetical protein
LEVGDPILERSNRDSSAGWRAALGGDLAKFRHALPAFVCQLDQDIHPLRRSHGQRDLGAIGSRDELTRRSLFRRDR